MEWFHQYADLWGNDIPWLAGLREKGRMAFDNCGLPSVKNEAWKYSALKSDAFNNPKIEVMNNHTCNCHNNDNCHCHCHDVSPFNFDCYCIHFCNGHLKDEEFDLPHGVIVKPLVEAIFDKDAQKYLNKSFEIENFPFASLNTAYLENGILLIIEHNAIIDKPICLYYHNSGEINRWNNIHNVIVAESGAQAKIVEYYKGNNGTYFNNIVNEFFIASNAFIKHFQKVDEASDALHIGLNSVIIRNKGNYKSFCLNGESKLSRIETYIQLQQNGANAQVDGVYKLSNHGTSDIVTNIKHLAEHTTSNQLVKGVLDGNSKGVFQGQIHIAPHAQKTEGYQLHRALLLSNSAEVNCKPELEIFADDVSCSHGATCGDLDKEQLFYMQSRGISLDEARSILIDAYLQEVFLRIDETDIRNWLSEEFVK